MRFECAEEKLFAELLEQYCKCKRLVNSLLYDQMPRTEDSLQWLQDSNKSIDQIKIDWTNKWMGIEK